MRKPQTDGGRERSRERPLQILNERADRYQISSVRPETHTGRDIVFSVDSAPNARELLTKVRCICRLSSEKQPLTLIPCEAYIITHSQTSNINTYIDFKAFSDIFHTQKSQTIYTQN